MSEISGHMLAELLINLNINMVRWSRMHLERVFSVNGKGEEGKLTTQQFHIMIAIQKFELNTVSDMAEAFCLSKSSVSLTVSKMVTKGYLEKKSPIQGDDGRKIYFCLTKKGQQAMEETQKILTEISGQHFDLYDSETKKALFDHLNALNQLLVTGGTAK